MSINWIGMLPKFLLPLLIGLPFSAGATDFTLSGFGTAGYAQSDKSYNYQRFISDDGTLKRDSVFGLQGDIKLSPQWGVTVQGTLTASSKSDAQWDGTLSWAFVSWRPVDTFLVRAGKFRLPFMLNTENSDVGATFDFARLPMEVYSIAPTTDVTGLSVSKTWLGDIFDWTLEAYTGKADGDLRYYGREMTDRQLSAGSWFLPIKLKSTGLVFTARNIDHVFRAGVHQVEFSRVGAQTGTNVVFKPLVPGLGYYEFDPAGKDRIFIPVYNLGASLLLPLDFRLTGEYARIQVDSASEGLGRWGAYLALSRRVGAWTPYVYYAQMKSRDSALEKYKRFNSNILPAPFSGLNPSQKLIADIVVPFDQSTTAIGTSFRVTPNGLIKTEWSHVRTGVASSLIDAPAGGDSTEKRINVFSLSYSFTF